MDVVDEIIGRAFSAQNRGLVELDLVDSEKGRTSFSAHDFEFRAAEAAIEDTSYGV